MATPIHDIVQPRQPGGERRGAVDRVAALGILPEAPVWLPSGQRLTFALCAARRSCDEEPIVAELPRLI